MGLIINLSLLINNRAELVTGIIIVRLPLPYELSFSISYTNNSTGYSLNRF